MKRTVAVVAVLLLTGMAAGVVDENGTSPSNEAGEGEVGITSGAEATTSVGPNGTEWTSRLSMNSSQCLANQSTGVTDSGFSDNSTEFAGVFQTPDPCHVLESEVVKESEGSYVFNITSKSTEDGACQQCVGAVSYTAAFDPGQPFELRVVHEGETVETLTHPDYDPEPDEQEKRGFLGSIVNWLAGLFD